MSATMGQFLAAIAHRESGSYADPYHHVEAGTGAEGKYQTLPGTWATWSKQYYGTVLDWTVPTNQEQVVTWKMTRRLDQLRVLFPNDSLTEVYQRLAAAWFDGMSVATADPTTWSLRVKEYVAGIGKYLTTTFAEGWL